MQVHTNYNNVSSKGLLKFLTSDPFTHSLKKDIKGKNQYICSLLGEPSYVIEKLTKDADDTKVSFLEALAKKYLSRNHRLPDNQKDSSGDMLDIYKSVENPTQEHFDIVTRTTDGFRTLKKIFSLANDKESIAAVLDLQCNILKRSPNSSEIIINLLSSDYKKTYVKDLNNFKSYLTLNSNNTDAVKNLDNLLKTNSYDSKLYDSKLEIKKLLQNRKAKDFISKIEDSLAENYTEERGKFLTLLTTDYLAHKRQLKFVDSKKIMDMYLSTNAENVEIRNDILNKFKYLAKNSADGELYELKLLFAKIEENKDARKFVQNTVDRNMPVDSVFDLNTIMSQVDLNKANYFFDNVKRIVALSRGEERELALKNEIENPFFEPKTKNYSKMLSYKNIYNISRKINRIKKYVNNQINLFLYAYFGNKTPIEETLNNGIKVKTRRTNKFKLAQEVNEYVKTKLGKRTFNEQEDIYRIKVTKMRLMMLPEIFASIKATRAQTRAKGLVPQSSNRDAARLYELINGKNKKIVRYMLKKTDLEGNRIFEVKQIIEFVEALKKNEIKNIDPAYKKAVSKDYYTNIYNSITGKYGKL